MGAARRVFNWLDDRLGLTSVFLPILQHRVPRSVNWWYVFGSATLVAFIVQVVTGIALAFSYVPSPNNAFGSIDFITHHETLGHVVRGIHYWGASAMVVLITIHAARVFAMGSYKYPRELNWLLGVVLLLLTLAMAFTGQLLRWDQDAYWAVVVAAEQAGRTPVIGPWLVRLVVAGDTVGGNTLTRFYATHVLLLPGLMFMLIGGHLFLVIRHGISEPPKAGVPDDPKTYKARYQALLDKEGIPFWPDAAWRDVVFALAVVAAVLALAIFVGPKELLHQADPTIVKTSPRPDWYFLWLFALLALSPPSLETILIIGLPLVAVIVLIAVPFVGKKGERSPKRRPWALAIVVALATLGVVLVREGDRAPWSPDLSATPFSSAFTAQLDAQGLSKGGDLFFQKGCIACHTVDGTGGKRGPNLSSVGTRLSSDEITWRILNGGHNMPAYGAILTPDELNELVTFLSHQRAP